VFFEILSIFGESYKKQKITRKKQNDMKLMKVLSHHKEAKEKPCKIFI
jgi:hypothetical protein